MIKGMTGFGSTQLSTGGIKALVEIKSVNQRYLDVNYYLPIGFGSIENKLRQILEKEVVRGRVTISIKIVKKPELTILLNKETVKMHLKYANRLKKEFHLENDLSLSDLIKLPGVLEAQETFVSPQEIWLALEKSFRKALKSLVTMRRKEGQALAADVMGQLKRMLLQANKIKARTNALLKEKKKKMTLEEFRSFQKGCDIHEELSRLTHYVDELKKLLKSTVSVGKKMDFLAQEMQRETNTIGSKLLDKTVCNAVVALKSKIEKIREQAQNIE